MQKDTQTYSLTQTEVSGGFSLNKLAVKQNASLQDLRLLIRSASYRNWKDRWLSYYMSTACRVTLSKYTLDWSMSMSQLMLKWFEMATRKHTAQHLAGEKGRLSQSVFLLTYGKAVRDRGEKHTQMFRKAAEAGTHHILPRVIGHGLLIRQQQRFGSTPSNQSMKTIMKSCT